MEARQSLRSGVIKAAVLTIILPVSLNIVFGVHGDVCLVFSMFMSFICVLGHHWHACCLNDPEEDDICNSELPPKLCWVCRFYIRHYWIDRLLLFSNYGMLATIYINQALVKYDFSFGPLYYWAISMAYFFTVDVCYPFLTSKTRYEIRKVSDKGPRDRSV